MEKAALSLAASIVSPIFSKLGDKAAPYFGGDVTDEEVKHLQNIILPKIRTVLRVAEAVPMDELNPWLTTLQDAAYEAEDVLDMYEYKRLEAQVSSSFRKFKMAAKDFFAPLSLKTELKKTMEKLQQSADEAHRLTSLYGTICQTPLMQNIIQQQQQQQLPTVSSLSTPVFGRDKERESLVNRLILTTNEHNSSRRHTRILAICGLGGAGKTTLAQCVYNDSRVVEHFDTRMWVHVSRKFNAQKVTTEIFESITKQGGCSDKLNNFDALQTRLKDILESKTFLLVLDDVWCEDNIQWDQMLAPLNEKGGTASRVLVTIRTQEVASRLGIQNVIPLEDLKTEDCIEIFKHYSFGDANKVIDDIEVAIVAEQIMKKLKNSPLSARMVGSLLRGKKDVSYWKRILMKDEMLKDTLDVLYLSFDNLAPHLQRCFAYCSLYPKGYHFDKIDDLVRIWISQGFVEVPYNNNMTVEDKGMQYFSELVSNSFFQKETTISGKDYFVIHDLLHDLAEEVSKGDCLRIEDDSKDIPPTTVRHLSIWKKDIFSYGSHIFTLENLRTFMITDQITRMDDFDRIIDGRNKMFEKFKKLRVLHLGQDRSSEFLGSIDQLKHLRSLQVHGVRRLPESLGKLYHIQFLNLKSCYFTDKVPKNLNNLINLRFLLGEDDIIPKIPFFGKFASLQNIKKYKTSSKEGHGIGQLKNLYQLRGSLSINDLENVQNRAEASEASLKEKILLEKLTLTWTCSPKRDGRIDEDVIKGLEPPPNLSVLRIHGYNGIEFPEWLINDGHFLRLSVLTIKNCLKLERVRSLPSTLKRLEVVRCEDLNEMPSLPSGLRILIVKSCPKLMQLSPYPPNLEELDMWGCPGVETLLSNILLLKPEDEQKQKEKDNQQHSFSLKTLSIRSCSVSGKKRLLSDPNKLFTSLTILELKELPCLTSLFHPDHKLTSLEDINIKECENLAELFGSPLASCPSLRCLKIRNCPRLAMQYSQPDMEGSFLLPSSVSTLVFRNCGDLEMNLPGRCLIGLTSLTKLKIGGCSHARSLPGLANPGALTQLIISDCLELTSMWNLQLFSSLRDLRVMGCPKLTIGLRERPPPSLTNITIDDLSLLTALQFPQREFPSSLSTLTIERCIAITEDQVEELFQGLSSLTNLSIWYCPNLASLPGNMIERLSSLRTLWIFSCPKIELLPNLPSSLEYLHIDNCHPQLKANYKKRGPLHHKVQHISLVDIW